MDEADRYPEDGETPTSEAETQESNQAALQIRQPKMVGQPE